MLPDHRSADPVQAVGALAGRATHGPRLTAREMRVLLALMARCLEVDDPTFFMSNREIATVTGIDLRDTRRVIRSLIAKGICERIEGGADARGVHRSLYRLTERPAAA